MVAVTGAQKTVLAVAGVLVILAGSVAGYRWWDGRDDGRTYPQSVRDNFLVSCAEAGAPDDACRCSLDVLENVYSLADFAAIDQEVRSGGFTGELFTQVAKKCGISGPAPGFSTSTSLAGDEGVYEDPQGGVWTEASGDATCKWSIVDYDGTVVDSGRSSRVTVPSQVAEFRTQPRCSWSPAA